MMKSLSLLFFLLSLSTSICAQSLAVHPWAKKRVAYFGDSITDKNRNATKKYWSYLSDWLGIESFVYGISGRQWNDIPNQTDKLLAQHGQDVDAIVIFIGTNDFNDGVPLGQWFSEVDTTVLFARRDVHGMVSRRMRTPVMDSSTLRGRINIAMSKLKQAYPDKQIVVLTPIHRASANFSDSNIQPSEAYTNMIGVFFSDYVQAIMETANVWSVPVIDLNSLCGLSPEIDAFGSDFMDAQSDRLHPSNKGHERIARTLFYQLASLPVF